MLVTRLNQSTTSWVTLNRPLFIFLLAYDSLPYCLLVRGGPGLTGGRGFVSG